jgi:hypothetical protein
MAADCFLVDLFSSMLWASDNTTVTCAGVVRAPNGAVIQRKIVVYQDNNPYEVIAVAESSQATGEFSVTFGGHAAQDFTVVAKGEYGENDEVVANCNLNGTGPTGLYIAQPLNNIQFFVGPGAVNSPFVDILFPMPEVDAEGQVDIVAWGDVNIPYSVEAEGLTQIIAHGDVNFGFAQVEGFGSSIYMTSGAINFPDPIVECEATGTYISWGNVEIPRPVVTAFTTDEGGVVFPSPVAEAVGITPIICHGVVDFARAVVGATGKAGSVSQGDANFPIAVISGYVLVTETCQGAITIPGSIVSALAIREEIALGTVSIPMPVVNGFAASQHAFIPMAYNPDCGVEGVA